MNYSASGVWMEAMKDHDREQKRLKEFYNDIEAKIWKYNREQGKIPKEVREIERKNAFLLNNINGINREISDVRKVHKLRIAGADSSNYYEGLDKIIKLIDKSKKIKNEIEKLEKRGEYVSSMSTKFKGRTFGTRSRSRSRGGAKKKNKTSKKQPKIPKDFCKKSLKFPNVKKIRNNTRKVVCFNPLFKKECEKKFDKTFNKGYLEKCEKKMKELRKIE
jgi:hypothetical protein